MRKTNPHYNTVNILKY